MACVVDAVVMATVRIGTKVVVRVGSVVGGNVDVGGDGDVVSATSVTSGDGEDGDVTA